LFYQTQQKCSTGEYCLAVKCAIYYTFVLHFTIEHLLLQVNVYYITHSYRFCGHCREFVWHRNTSQNETYRSNISQLSIILTPIWPINVLLMNDKYFRPFTLMHWECCLACSRITNVHVPWTRRISEHVLLPNNIYLSAVPDVPYVPHVPVSGQFVWHLPINIFGSDSGKFL
jgi:hypothetical protein